MMGVLYCAFYTIAALPLYTDPPRSLRGICSGKSSESCAESAYKQYRGANTLSTLGAGRRLVLSPIHLAIRAGPTLALRPALPLIAWVVALHWEGGGRPHHLECSRACAAGKKVVRHLIPLVAAELLEGRAVPRMRLPCILRGPRPIELGADIARVVHGGAGGEGTTTRFVTSQDELIRLLLLNRSHSLTRLADSTSWMACDQTHF